MGKTIQTLVLCDILPTWKVVCVMPVILLSCWEAEIGKFEWRYNTYIITKKSMATEAIEEWREKNGVIFVGYELYLNLLKSEKVKAVLNQPDMLIFDEGHRIKNMASKMCAVFNDIKCKRRLILTGYPLQNNLIEYFCMMQFLQANYLGHIKTFKKIFVTPIESGQCIDSSEEDVNIMKQRVYVLNKLLSRFVHRQNENLAMKSLPSLEHNVILIKMTDLQKEFVNKLQAIYGNNALTQYTMTLRIMTHPDMILDSHMGLEDDIKTKFEYPADYVSSLLESSPKLELCFQILDECVKQKDKVIIFSQSIDALNQIEKFLKLCENYKWLKNWNYFRKFSIF